MLVNILTIALLVVLSVTVVWTFHLIDVVEGKHDTVSKEDKESEC